MYLQELCRERWEGERSNGDFGCHPPFEAQTSQCRDDGSDHLVCVDADRLFKESAALTSHDAMLLVLLE
eukprot:1046100-Amphidinium_carterae.1